MILAFPVPAPTEGLTYYEFAPEEQPVYDPETGEPTGTETTYLTVPETQLLVHGDLEIDGELRRIVTYHPGPKEKARVLACVELKAPDWDLFHDRYLSQYRKCRLVTSLKVDGEGNPVQETLDDYIMSGDNPVEIQTGHMAGGAFLGLDD